jgi:hypothetical protein
MKRIRIESQLFRHEADLNHRAYAVLEQPVVHLVHVGKVVDGISVFIFVVDTQFVVKDRVKPYIPEIRDLFYSAQIVPVTLSKRQNGPAGSKHLFPEVWKRCRGCLCIDEDLLLA